ncbi:hypothetical protein BD414DRAFT_483866 [Trametes punicea]|nr:hypothetical protein BD414DRAFT_483866 [Trametes punicea]
MSWLASVALVLLHAVYRLVLVYKSFRSDKEPRPIIAERSKLPSHLALALVTDPDADDESNEEYMVNSVEKVAGWCRVAGIRQLTVYDREGVLARCSLEIRKRLLPPFHKEDDDESPVECDIQYPLTPPPSDDADSRPLSPHSVSTLPKLNVTTMRFPPKPSQPKRRVSVQRGAIKRRRVSGNNQKAEEPLLTLHIISYQSGKPAVAAAAQTILNEIRQSKVHKSVTSSSAVPSLQELNAVLEGEHGFPSPDLMIVHRKPPISLLRPAVELSGFPPWQTRLTEIYWNPYPPTTTMWWRSPIEKGSSIQESEFRRALDEFASAEMRQGK